MVTVFAETELGDDEDEDEDSTNLPELLRRADDSSNVNLDWVFSKPRTLAGCGGFADLSSKGNLLC